MNKALGLIEVKGLVSAIEAADSAVKAANVNLLGIEKVSAGIVTVKITGDVGAVKAAVEAAGASAKTIGNLRGTHVIPRVSEDVFGMIEKDNNKKQEAEEVKLEEAQEVEEVQEVDEVQEIELEVVDQKEELKEVETQVETEGVIKEVNNEISNEKLINMSVKELRKLVKERVVNLTNQEVKAFKKDELIEMIIQSYRKEK